MTGPEKPRSVALGGRKVTISYGRTENTLEFAPDERAAQCLPMLRNKLEKSLALKKLQGVKNFDLLSFGQGKTIVYADGTDHTKFDASTVRIATSIVIHLRDYGASI